MIDAPPQVPFTGRLLTEGPDDLIIFDEAVKLLRNALGSYNFAFEWLLWEGYFHRRVLSMPESQTFFWTNSRNINASAAFPENWENSFEERTREIHNSLTYLNDDSEYVLNHENGIMSIIYEIDPGKFYPRLDDRYKYMIKVDNIRFSLKQIREWSGLDDLVNGPNSIINGPVDEMNNRPNLNNNRGRPKKHDWEGALIHLIGLANTPDGLPTGYGANSSISKMILEWFASHGFDEPAKSEASERAARILRIIDPA